METAGIKPSEALALKTVDNAKNGVLAQLSQAQADLNGIYIRIDAGEEPTALINKLAAGSSAALVTGIDRCKAIVAAFEARLAIARSVRRDANDEVQRSKAFLQTFKDGVKKLMQENPDQPYRDSMGRKVYLKNNAPALKLKFEVRESTTVRDVVDLNALEFFGVDPKRFCKTVTFIVADKPAIATALKAGEQLPWAAFERGQHVSGLSLKQDDVGVDSSAHAENHGRHRAHRQGAAEHPTGVQLPRH
jgi:hypothetical protein